MLAPLGGEACGRRPLPLRPARDGGAGDSIVIDATVYATVDALANAGADRRPDAPPPGADAGVEVMGGDAGIDSAPDQGSIDAGNDLAIDAAIDAGPDQLMARDAGSDVEAGRAACPTPVLCFTTHTLCVSRFTEFPVAGDSNQNLPYITAGPDGNLWFTERDANKIGRITTTGVITEFPIPAAGATPDFITAGPDGNLWFTERFSSNPDGQIGRITTAGVVTQFPLPTGPAEPASIVAGPDGNLWITEWELQRITRMTVTGAVTSFATMGWPGWITSGSDGRLWFVERFFSGGFKVGDAIGAMTTDGAIAAEMPPLPNIASITQGPDGNFWFTEGDGNNIGRVTPGGRLTEFPIPTTNSGAQAMVAGRDGNLWFTEFAASKIGRITPDGEICEFPLQIAAGANPSPNGIAAGPDGNLWFVEFSANRVVRFDPRAHGD